MSVTLIYPYYDNPNMLRRHLAEWMDYPEYVRERIEFIVVDDASPNKSAMSVVSEERSPMNLSVYRVSVDRPWGQDAARNIGMMECTTLWALMSDMDHLLPKEESVRLLNLVDGQAKPGVYYMPMRVRASGAMYHPHPNTFLFNRADFWGMGGYDEDFVGFYGSDGNFRKCAKGAGLVEFPCEAFKMVLFSTSDVADANTRTLTRKEGPLWAAKNPKLDAKRRGPAYKASNPIRAAYTRVL